jgi:hypothetical protein
MASDRKATDPVTRYADALIAIVTSAAAIDNQAYRARRERGRVLTGSFYRLVPGRPWLRAR